MNDEYMDVMHDIVCEDEMCQRLFLDYVNNCFAFIMKARITNPRTGKMSEPNEVLMRKVEYYLDLPDQAVADYRRMILSWASARPQMGKMWNSDSDLSAAILRVVHEQISK